MTKNSSTGKTTGYLVQFTFNDARDTEQHVLCPLHFVEIHRDLNPDEAVEVLGPKFGPCFVCSSIRRAGAFIDV